MHKRIVTLLCCVFLSIAAASPQSFLGSIAGTVTDPSGAAIAAAKVALTETQTGIQQSATTALSGEYLFTNVPPGVYSVSVTAPGFKEVKSGGIVLTGHQAQRFDARLEVGASTESIVVSAAAPTVNTENGEIAGVQSRAELINAPTNSRSTVLLFFTNSFNYQGGSGSFYSIGGLRGVNTNFTIDGTGSNSVLFGNQSGPQTEVSLEGVRDMKFMASNNSAEFSKVATVFIESRGGENQLHGSLFYTQVNGKLNARNTFSSSAPAPTPQQHQLGGSIGGPVWIPKIYDGHNRTFFFFSFEQNRFPGGSLSAANVPTLAMRNGDFSGISTTIKDPTTSLPFPNNRIPSASISSVSSAMQTFGFPQPNTGLASNFSGNYQFYENAADYSNRFSARIDHQVSQNDRVSGRLSVRNDPDMQGVYDTSLPAFIHYQYRRNINTYLSETHIFSPALVNEFRIGFSRDHSAITGTHNGNDLLKQFGIVGANPNTQTGIPTLNLDGGSFTSWYEYPSYMYTSQAIEILDNVTYSRGKHNLRIGTTVRHSTPNVSQNPGCDFGCYDFDGTMSGFDYSDFLLGIPTSTTRAYRAPNSYYRWNSVGLYVQEAYKVSQRLTVNLGLRWEYNQPPSDKNNERYAFNPATDGVVVPDAKAAALVSPLYPANIRVQTASDAGYPSPSLLHSHWHDFAPRVSFAYMVPGKSDFVIRGGYGIFYSPLLGSLLSAYSGGPFGSKEIFTNQLTNGKPLFQFPSPFGGSASIPSQSVDSYDPNVRTPYVQQWNLSVDRDLGRQLVARVSYRAFRSVQIPYTANLNLPAAGATSALEYTYAYPNFATANWSADGGIQKMNGLDLSLERKFASGFTFQSQYTLAKNQSDVGNDDERATPEDPRNRARDMADVSFMPRQRWVTQGLYELPFGKGKTHAANANRLVNGVVGGWQVSAFLVEQSGQFLDAQYSGKDILHNRNKSGRPDCVGDPSVAHQSISQYYNVAAFAIPAAGNFGSCSRNILTGPGINDVNIGLMKNFRLTERAHLQFKATTTNAFNHPLYANPNVTITSSNFGKITNVLGTTTNRGSLGSAGYRTINIGARIDF